MDLGDLQAAIVAALGLWFGVATLNNAVDPASNATGIRRMMTMEGIADEPVAGRALLGRAWANPPARAILLVLTVYEAIVSLGLIASGALLSHWSAWSHARAVGAANFALAGLALLFLAFMTGGVWFAYWVRMLPTQMSHFALLAVALGAMILVNLPLPQ